ncbi:ParA family protein [Paracoccus sediminis]|uniref:Chromosome partitioning protein ParA n=1 Tax=Paracoccus sediminis TaxID=1214787 RepID=A0A238VIM2_9RHOB|nr:AAA family ATPase [Paracoccus sediminis]TBN52064.1 ParA family protein [Paracoccus sediminis]SNR33349.1 chromosome segregation ATPase [Paracoccus sediminis]
MAQYSIVAIANQKGGVGKTTTAINLGAALAMDGRRTILIDLDPQGNASTGLGIDIGQRHHTVYDLLAGPETLSECIVPTRIPNLSIVPATSDLSSADVDLAQAKDRTQLLRRKLGDAPEGAVILIDCPPALGLLTVNAMIAADAVLVPLQAEFYALEGLSQLLTTVRHVRQSGNPDLRINGVLLTMSDYRNNLSQQVEADARATLGDLVFPTVIPRNVRVSEAPSFAQPVLLYDPSSKGSLAYRKFAAEFAVRLKPAKEEA